MSENKVALGIIGGSGLYSFEGLENRRTVIVDTPFGLPSSPVILGEVHGKQLAFLARHGIGHTISPSEINYRANIYAAFLGKVWSSTSAQRILSAPCSAQP